MKANILKWNYWNENVGVEALKPSYWRGNMELKYWNQNIEVKTYKWKHQHECINMQNEHIEFEILKLNYRSRSMEVKTCLD